MPRCRSLPSLRGGVIHTSTSDDRAPLIGDGAAADGPNTVRNLSQDNVPVVGLGFATCCTYAVHLRWEFWNLGLCVGE
jgi:hypothetical protein